LRSLKTLTELESDCLGRHLSLLERRLGRRLPEVRMFGSAARGDMWSASAPMRSDIDLLVVTRDGLTGTDVSARVATFADPCTRPRRPFI
jgi:predicted nucleotidyltransferase